MCASLTLALLQVSSAPSTTETPLYFDALLPKFVHREFEIEIEIFLAAPGRSRLVGLSFGN